MFRTSSNNSVKLLAAISFVLVANVDCAQASFVGSNKVETKQVLRQPSGQSRETSDSLTQQYRGLLATLLVGFSPPDLGGLTASPRQGRGVVVPPGSSNQAFFVAMTVGKPRPTPPALEARMRLEPGAFASRVFASRLFRPPRV